MFNPAIAKIGLGGATVIGTGATGYYFRERIFGWFSSEKEVFLIAKNSTSTVDTELSGKELYATENTKKEIIKNFKCQVGTNIDETCDIFSLPTVTGKLLDLPEIKKFENKAKKTELTNNNNLFAIKVEPSFISEWKKDQTITLNILSKDVKKTGNSNEFAKFADFTLLYKISEKNVEGKTNIFLTKAQQLTTSTPAVTIESSSTFECQIENDPTTKQDCSIYKFTDALAEKQTYKNLSFDSGKISAPSNISEIKKDSYYLIVLKTDNYDLSKLTQNSTVVFVKKTTTPPSTQEIGKFTHISSMYNKDSSFTAGTTKPIFLS